MDGETMASGNRMKAFEILDKLQNEVENASNVPLLSNKVMLERNDILDLVDDLRNTLPEEIQAARKIVEDEVRIRQAARRKADSLVEEAKAAKQELIDTSAITRNAYEEADAIVRNAKIEAGKLRARSIEYVYNLLGQAQEEMRNLIATLDTNREELRDKRGAAAGPEG
jgi:cell division septum initiation protein DivIVA